MKFVYIEETPEESDATYVTRAEEVVGDGTVDVWQCVRCDDGEEENEQRLILTPECAKALGEWLMKRRR